MNDDMQSYAIGIDEHEDNTHLNGVAQICRVLSEPNEVDQRYQQQTGIYVRDIIINLCILLNAIS